MAASNKVCEHCRVKGACAHSWMCVSKAGTDYRRAARSSVCLRQSLLKSLWTSKSSQPKGHMGETHVGREREREREDSDSAVKMGRQRSEEPKTRTEKRRRKKGKIEKYRLMKQQWGWWVTGQLVVNPLPTGLYWKVESLLHVGCEESIQPINRHVSVSKL